MSTSQPPPILILTVSPPSFRSLPRSGTLMSPSATCRTTGSPIHPVYALSIPLPRGFDPDVGENRAALCGRQWYSEGRTLVRTYCWEFGQRFVPLVRPRYVRTVF